MGHYSNSADMVRVDFFRPSGKWYCTEAVKWTGEYERGLLHREFAKSLHDHLYTGGVKRLAGMQAICLEPFHQHSHPIILMVDEIENEMRDRKAEK